VKQFFDKLKEERKKWLNPEKPYFYVKQDELRKKVADQRKKQQEAQKNQHFRTMSGLWSSLHSLEKE